MVESAQQGRAAQVGAQVQHGADQTNLAARAYPAILVKTSVHDSQVMYWEPAKWVARLPFVLGQLGLAPAAA
ncbi:MAG: prolyl oligopeptidase family serine peptidase [Candidatus Rokubacteria bacterium]|nr:prolyl oligopeptidase family serine peptidase [Candidatus Rokubacteria bacterium]